MRKAFSLLVLALSAIISVGQSSSTTAIITTPTAYFDATPGVPTLTTYSLQATSGETFNSCAGSQSVYWFRFNIPTPGSSLNGTRSVKITCNTSNFTPIIDFFDAGLVWMECANGAVLRTNPTTNPINYNVNYYVRISSASFSPGSSFAFGIETYPVAELASNFYPTRNTDPDGYKPCDQIQRNLINSSYTPLIQNQRWTLSPVLTPNVFCQHLITGSSGIQLITNFPCVCFGMNVNVSVELRVDNHWCGVAQQREIFMQTANTTSITTPTNTTLPFTSTIDATFACANTIYEWEFATAGGPAVLFQSNSGSLPLNSVDCLRFNRIYQVRVRAISCGITGPWCGVAGPGSAPCLIFTPPLPVINAPDSPPTNDFCYSSVPLNSVVDVPFFAGVEQYIFQFTRVSPAAPFLPIASPKIVFSNNSLCGLSFANVQAGGTYRVGIKPGLASCNSPQQGDYGPWCYFSIAPAAPPVAAMPTVIDQVEQTEEPLYKSSIVGEDYLDISVSGYGEMRILNISTNEQEILRTGEVVLYDLNGREVFQQTMYGATGVTMIQLELPSDLPTGIYIARVKSDSRVQSGKIFIPGSTN